MGYARSATLTKKSWINIKMISRQRNRDLKWMCCTSMEQVHYKQWQQSCCKEGHLSCCQQAPLMRRHNLHMRKKQIIPQHLSLIHVMDTVFFLAETKFNYTNNNLQRRTFFSEDWRQHVQLPSQIIKIINSLTFKKLPTKTVLLFM